MYLKCFFFFYNLGLSQVWSINEGSNPDQLFLIDLQYNDYTDITQNKCIFVNPPFACHAMVKHTYNIVPWNLPLIEWISLVTNSLKVMTCPDICKIWCYKIKKFKLIISSKLCLTVLKFYTIIISTNRN